MGSCISPGGAGIHDSRALARVLAGDVDGAIEDFQFFIDSGQGFNVDWRQGWVERLEAGEEPAEIFDEKTLEAIRNE